MLKKKVALMVRLTRGASGSFTGGGGTNTDSEFFGRNATAEELETLQNDWIVACSQENQVLHKNVLAEFKKRIKDAGVTGGKAKLDFRSGNLNDRQLMLLVLVLSKRPVICRLEIEADDITNQSLSAICNILEVQMKFCRDLDVDNRLQACFLGEVILEGKNTHLDPAVIQELARSCYVLKYANAIAYIRSNYLNDHAGAQSKATIEGSYLDKIWLKVVGHSGKQDPFKIIAAYEAAHVTVKDFITYEELEKVLICGLIERGALITLTQEQMRSVHFIPIQEAPSPARAASHHSIPHSAPHSPVPSSATNDGLKGSGIAMASTSLDIPDDVVGNDLLLSPISPVIDTYTEQYRFYTSEDVNGNDFTPYKPQYDDNEKIAMKPRGQGDNASEARHEAVNSNVNVRVNEKSTADLLGIMDQDYQVPMTGPVHTYVDDDLVFGTQLDDDDDLLRYHRAAADADGKASRSKADQRDLSGDSSDFDYDNYDQGYEQVEEVIEENKKKAATNDVVNPFEDDAIFEAVVGQSVHKVPPPVSTAIPSYTEKNKVDVPSMLSTSLSLSDIGDLVPAPSPMDKKMIIIDKVPLSQLKESNHQESTGTVIQEPPKQSLPAAAPASVPSLATPILTIVDAATPPQKQQQQPLIESVAAVSSGPEMILKPDALTIPTPSSAPSTKNQSNKKTINRASSFILSASSSPKPPKTLSRSHSMTSTTPCGGSNNNSGFLTGFELKLQELENNIRSGSLSSTMTPRNDNNNAGSVSPVVPYANNATSDAGSTSQLRSDLSASLQPIYEGELLLAPAPARISPPKAQQNSPTRHQIVLPLSPAHAVAASSSASSAPPSPNREAASTANVQSLVQVEQIPLQQQPAETKQEPLVEDRTTSDDVMVIRAQASIPQPEQPSSLLSASLRQKVQAKQSHQTVPEKKKKAESKEEKQPQELENEIEVIAQTLTVNNHQLRAVDTLFTRFNLADKISTLSTLNLAHNKLGPSLASLSLFTSCPVLTSLDLSCNLFKGKILDNDLPRTLKQANFASNQLVDVMGLMSCITLQKLDLSSNSIKHIFGLPPTVTNLNLAQNKIAAVSSLRSLSICSNLTHLSVQGNSVLYSLTMPRVYLKSFLLHLEVIDGTRIVAEKPSVAFSKQQALSKPVLSHSHTPAANNSKPRTSNVSPSRKQQQQQEFVDKLTKRTAASIVRNLNSFEDPNTKKVKMTQEEVDKITRRLAVPRPSQHSSPPAAMNAIRNSSISPARKEAFIPSGSPASSRMHNQTRQPTQQTVHDESKDSKSPSKRNRSQSPSSNHNHNHNSNLDVQLKQWRNKKALQLIQIAALFRIPFAFIVLNTVPFDHAQTFFEEVDFYQKQLEIPLTIRRAMHAPNCIDELVLEDINTRQTLMQKSIQLLQQIQTAMMLTLNSEVKVDFPRAVDVMMKSALGQVVNEQLLKGLDCYYTGLEALLPVPPPPTVVNVAEADGNGDNSVGESGQEETKDKVEVDYAHRIRDVESTDNNNEYIDVSAVIVVDKSEDDQQKEALLAKQKQQAKEEQKEASMYLDRMRQRVAMRFMPPSLLTPPATVEEAVEEPPLLPAPVVDTFAAIDTLPAPAVLRVEATEEKEVERISTFTPAPSDVAVVPEPVAAFKSAPIECQARTSKPQAEKPMQVLESSVVAAEPRTEVETVGFKSVALLTADDTSLPPVTSSSNSSKPPLPPSTSSGNLQTNQDSLSVVSVAGASKAMTASERLKQRLNRMRSEKALNSSAGSSSQDLPSLAPAEGGNGSDASAAVAEASPLPLLSFYIESSSQEAVTQQQTRALPFTSAYSIDDFTKQEVKSLPAAAPLAPVHAVEEQYPAAPSFSDFKSLLASDPTPVVALEGEAEAVAPPTADALLVPSASTTTMSARDRIKARLAQSKLEKQASLANVKEEDPTAATS